jgi:hypothetical protein
MFGKTKTKFNKVTVFYLVFNLIATLGLFSFNPTHTTAASLTVMSDTLSRLKKSTASNHTIKFRTPTGAGDDTDTIRVNFPAGFNVGPITFTDIDLSHGAVTGYELDEPLANAADPTHWGAVFGGQNLTLTHPTDGAAGDIAASDYVVVEIGNHSGGGINQITNPNSAAVYTINIDGAFGDTGAMKVVIIDDDQVVVGTTIDEMISFTINENAVTLKKADGNHPDFTNTGYNIDTPLTLAATTNSTLGYNITYFGSTLKSGGNQINAMAAKAVSQTGVSQFGMNLKDNATPNTGADPVGGTGAPMADYNTADQYKFVADTTTTMASVGVASEPTTYTVSFIANIAATTAAGVYSTTITYICVINF